MASIREETTVERVVDGFHDGLLLVELARVLNIKRAFCGMDPMDFVFGGGTAIFSPPTTGAGEPEDDQLVTSATRCVYSGFRVLITLLLAGTQQAFLGIKTVGAGRYVWVSQGTDTPLPAPDSWDSFFSEHFSPLAYFFEGAKDPHTWKSAVVACKDMLNAMIELRTFTISLTRLANKNTMHSGFPPLPVEEHAGLSYYTYWPYAITPYTGDRHLPSGVSWGVPYLSGYQIFCKWYFEGHELTSNRTITTFDVPFDKLTPPYRFRFLHGEYDITMSGSSIVGAMQTNAPAISDASRYYPAKVYAMNQGQWEGALGTVGANVHNLVSNFSEQDGQYSSLSIEFGNPPFQRPVYRVRRGSSDWTPYLFFNEWHHLYVPGVVRSAGNVTFGASTPGVYSIRCTLTRIHEGTPPAITAKLTIAGVTMSIASAGQTTATLSLQASEGGTQYPFVLEFEDYENKVKENADFEVAGYHTTYTEADNIGAGEYMQVGKYGKVHAHDFRDPSWNTVEGPKGGYWRNKVCKKGPQHTEIYTVWDNVHGQWVQMGVVEQDLDWERTNFRPEPLITESNRLVWKSQGRIMVSFELELA